MALQLHIFQLLYYLAIQWTLCPSISNATFSDLPLNDSLGCPGSNIELPALHFIINDTLSARHLNM